MTIISTPPTPPPPSSPPPINTPKTNSTPQPNHLTSKKSQTPQPLDVNSICCYMESETGEMLGEGTTGCEKISEIFNMGRPDVRKKSVNVKFSPHHAAAGEILSLKEEIVVTTSDTDLPVPFSSPSQQKESHFHFDGCFAVENNPTNLNANAFHHHVSQWIHNQPQRIPGKQLASSLDETNQPASLSLIVFYGMTDAGKTHCMSRLVRVLSPTHMPPNDDHTHTMPNKSQINTLHINAQRHLTHPIISLKQLKHMKHGWIIHKVDALDTANTTLLVELNPLQKEVQYRKMASEEQTPSIDNSGSSLVPPSLPAPPELTQKHILERTLDSHLHSWNTFFTDLQNPRSFLYTSILKLLGNGVQCGDDAREKGIFKTFSYSLCAVACCTPNMEAEKSLCTLKFSQTMRPSQKEKTLEPTKNENTPENASTREKTPSNDITPQTAEFPSPPPADASIAEQNPLMSDTASGSSKEMPNRHMFTSSQTRGTPKSPLLPTREVASPSHSYQSLDGPQLSPLSISSPPPNSPPSQSPTRYSPRTLNRLQEQYVHLQNETMEKIAQFEQLQLASDEEYHQSQQVIHEQSNFIKEKTSQISKLQQERNDLQRTIEQHQQKIDENKVTIADLHEKLRNISKEYHRLLNSEESRQKEVSRLKESLEKSQANIVKLSEQLEQKNSSIQSQKEQINRLELEKDEFGEKRDEFAQKQEEFAQTQEHLLQTKEQLKQVSHQLEQSVHNVETLQEEIKQISLREAEYSQEKDRVSEQFESTHKQLQESIAMQERRQSEIQHLKQDLHEATKELNKLKKENIQHKEHAALSTEKLDKFERMLREAQESLQKKEQQLSEYKNDEKIQLKKSSHLEEQLQKLQGDYEESLGKMSRKHQEAVKQSSRTLEELQKLQDDYEKASQTCHRAQQEMEEKLRAVELRLDNEHRGKESVSFLCDRLEEENRRLRKQVSSLEHSQEFLKMDLKRSSMRIEELENIGMLRGGQDPVRESHLRKELQSTKKELSQIKQWKESLHINDNQKIDRSLYDSLKSQFMEQSYLLKELQRSDAMDKLELLRNVKRLIFHLEKQKGEYDKLEAKFVELERRSGGGVHTTSEL